LQTSFRPTWWFLLVVKSLWIIQGITWLSYMES
jgi:hypothetical protein